MKMTKEMLNTIEMLSAKAQAVEDSKRKERAEKARIAREQERESRRRSMLSVKRFNALKKATAAGARLNMLGDIVIRDLHDSGRTTEILANMKELAEVIAQNMAEI